MTEILKNILILLKTLNNNLFILNKWFIFFFNIIKIMQLNLRIFFSIIF